MRAMILAAGLGTRMRPLSDLCAKPALPVRGRPVISLLLSYLARHGVEEVMINLHHRPETVREAVERDCPESLRIEWSEEATPLGTGGGIRRAASFLRETELCVVLAGDMLLDLDLGGVVARHRASGRDATLVLREDERTSRFGSIGLDEKGRVARLGAPLPGREERAAGLFTGLRIFSREILAHWPSQLVFEDLRDWLVPAILERGAAVRMIGAAARRSDGVMALLGACLDALNEHDLSLLGLARRWRRVRRRIRADREDMVRGRRTPEPCHASDQTSDGRLLAGEEDSVPHGCEP